MRAVSLSLLVLLCACNDKSTPPENARVEFKPTPVAPRDAGPAITYTVKFPDAKNHYVDVEAVFPGKGDTTTLMMAVWTPGSYMVREYSRNLEGLRATDLAGAFLKTRKTRKNRWEVLTKGNKQFAVRYRVYCNELSVQSNFVDADMAVLNGASTFLTLVDGQDAPHDVLFETPETWKLVTAMPPHADKKKNHFVVPNFDILVDSPVIAGDVKTYEFAMEGVPHTLANLGEAGIWDGARSAKDVEKIAKAATDFWRVIPYERYVFFNVLMEGRGGLEHLNSTLMMTSRFQMRRPKTYRGWLGLVSHEFFHAWNVKRMRPTGLGPFDYENEVYTPMLWVAEGVTSYYDDLLLVRAGLITGKEYLDALSQTIEEIETKPGPKVQPLSQSSFDAWIKFYRGDENSDNTTVSYYRKGAVVGLLLDAFIREKTGGERSLDDVMRLAYQRFSGEKGYTADDFKSIVAEVAAQPVDDFFASAVDGVDALDYKPMLAHFGLRFAPAKADPDTDKVTPSHLGVDMTGDVVKTVLRDTPAYAAGIGPGDELIAINNTRIPTGQLSDRLEIFRPGETVTFLIARRGLLKSIPVTLAEKPKTSWKLEVDPAASGAAKKARTRWLGSGVTDRSSPATVGKS